MSDFTVALVETLHVYSPHMPGSVVTGEYLRDDVDKEASFSTMIERRALKFAPETRAVSFVIIV
jgi:hypothetical protein